MEKLWTMTQFFKKNSVQYFDRIHAQNEINFIDFLCDVTGCCYSRIDYNNRGWASCNTSWEFWWYRSWWDSDDWSSRCGRSTWFQFHATYAVCSSSLIAIMFTMFDLFMSMVFRHYSCWSTFIDWFNSSHFHEYGISNHIKNNSNDNGRKKKYTEFHFANEWCLLISRQPDSYNISNFWFKKWHETKQFTSLF